MAFYTGCCGDSVWRRANTLKATLAVVMAIAVNPPVAIATSWRVERDGTGDFYVIQDAVDAAASGDTIFVGAGRYDEKRIVTCPGWSEYVRVLVTKPNLAIIGMGDATVIGQEEPWSLDQGEHKGIVAGEYWNSPSVVIQGVCFQNMGNGIYTSDARATIRGCIFRDNWKSLGLIDGDPAIVDSCEFMYVKRDGSHIACFGQNGLTIRDCEFFLWDSTPLGQFHVILSGVNNGVVEHCRFFEGAEAVIPGLGGSATIRDCEFDGQSTAAVVAGAGATVTIQDCRFRNQALISTIYSNDSSLYVYSSVIEDVQYCSIQISYADEVVVRSCDIAAGENGAIWVEDQYDPCVPRILEFKDNYWGTDNPDSIRAWIRDRNDSEDACFYIDFEPFRNVSTPVEKATLSDVKALFRPGGR